MEEASKVDVIPVELTAGHICKFDAKRYAIVGGHESKKNKISNDTRSSPVFVELFP